jgi:hypothetical protein
VKGVVGLPSLAWCQEITAKQHQACGSAFRSCLLAFEGLQSSGPESLSTGLGSHIFLTLIPSTASELLGKV